LQSHQITIALVLPLGLIQLSDNIKYQIASFITLLFITTVWIVTFFQVGINNNSIPVVASDQGSVVGYVISNFAFVTTIPAFVNNIHPSTNIHRVIWLSIIISCAIYLSIGFTGAAAFNTPPNSTILAVISERRPSLVALISVYAFPIAVLITSIPVFMIIIRYNLLRGNICSKPWAIFFSSILPWIIVIPFQTNGWLTIIMNWTSLFFSSTANLVIPFILYLVSKRYHASAALDLHQQHDEFRLSALTSPTSPITTAIATSPIRHKPPHIQISIPNDDPATNDLHDTPLLSGDPGPSTSGDVIRLIRSPSVHRHYGQTPEGSGPLSPRRLSITTSHRTSIPVAVVTEDDDDNDEKTDLTLQVPRMSTTAAAIADDEEKPHLTLEIPRVSLTVPSNSTAASPRASSAVEHYTSNIAPSPIHGIRRSSSVPGIKIELPPIIPRPASQVAMVRSPSGSADPEHRHRDTAPFNPLRRLGHILRSLVKNFRVREISHLDSYPAEVRLEEGGVGDGIEDDGEGGLSTNSSDDNIPHRTFEAFPKLNSKRWFDSTKVAIVFCGVTSVLICIDVIYNIVLAARGQPGA